MSEIGNEWRDTGFGGSGGRGSFQRLGSPLLCTKNGTQLQVWFRLPGQEETWMLSFSAESLAELAATAHGTKMRIYADTDTPLDVAIREVEGESTSAP